MKIYNVGVSFDSESDALEWAHGFVFGDCESTEQDQPRFSNHIESFDGVGVWYDFAGDYYFFEDESEDQ